MKKLLLGLMLVFISSNAMAEWTYIDDSKSGGSGDFSMYLDMSTLRKEANLIKIWQLNDYKNEQSFSDSEKFFSTRAQMEFNCKAEEVRVRAIIWSKGNMGHGEVTNTYNQISDWRVVPPSSINDEILKIVCDKK